MKHKATGLFLLIIILMGIGLEFGWMINKNKPVKTKPRQTLVDSLKIDSVTIKIYKE